MSDYKNNEKKSYTKSLKFVKGNSLAVDVGSCQGMYIDWMINNFDKVIAIEPALLNFGYLSKEYGWNEKVTLINAAVLDVVGKTQLFNSINKITSINGHWQCFPPEIEYSCIDIHTITIDSLNINPNLIKIDIQGSEYKALCGCIETINRCAPTFLIETVMNTKRKYDTKKFFDDKYPKYKRKLMGDREIYYV